MVDQQLLVLSIARRFDPDSNEAFLTMTLFRFGAAATTTMRMGVAALADVRGQPGPIAKSIAL